jgi:hypothetical protein
VKIVKGTSKALADATMRLNGCAEARDLEWIKPDRYRIPGRIDVGTLAYSEREARDRIAELIQADPATVTVEKF